MHIALSTTHRPAEQTEAAISSLAATETNLEQAEPYDENTYIYGSARIDEAA